jgi:hypothetical protein
MAKKKSSVPIIGSIVRSTTKGVSGAILTIHTMSEKVPVVGTAVKLVHGTMNAVTKTMGNIPGVKNVAVGVKRGVGKVAAALPITSNIKMGLSNATKAQKKSMKNANNTPK